jgi:hypothetical protein
MPCKVRPLSARALQALFKFQTQSRRQRPMHCRSIPLDQSATISTRRVLWNPSQPGCWAAYERLHSPNQRCMSEMDRAESPLFGMHNRTSFGGHYRGVKTNDTIPPHIYRSAPVSRTHPGIENGEGPCTAPHAAGWRSSLCGGCECCQRGRTANHTRRQLRCVTDLLLQNASTRGPQPAFQRRHGLSISIKRIDNPSL